MAGPPRGTHTKTQTEDHYTVWALKWSGKCTACTLEQPKPPFFKHMVHNRRGNQDVPVYTRRQHGFVFTPLDMVDIYFLEFEHFKWSAETDPEGVWGLEGVLWAFWWSLRLRRRGEFTGLDQGLRLRPNKVILCLHFWTLPPLDDLRRREREKEENVKQDKMREHYLNNKW